MRQVSRAEAERLGGPTDRPPREEVEWANPRTGVRMRVDRGLDPSWASNPGLDRERVLAAAMIAKLEALPDALGRAAIRRFVDGSPLERILAGKGTASPPRGDLPAGGLDGEWRAALAAKTRIVRLTPATVAHLRDDRPELTPELFRTLLPALLHDADLAYRATPRKGTGIELALVREFEGGKLWRLSIRRHSEWYVRMATIHRVQRRNLNAARRRLQEDEMGAVLRDRRGWLPEE